MATINQDQDPEQQDQNNLAAPPQVAGTSAGSGTGQGANGGTSGASPVAQNIAPQASQGYTDVSSYLNANQEGGQQLGNQVAQNLTNQYNTTKSGIDSSAQNALQAVNSGYTQQNNDLISQVLSNPVGASPDQVKAFQGQLNDTYTGPSGWADMGTQQGKVNSVLPSANASSPGMANVLTQQVEGPQSSQGINQLDTLLLTGNPNAMSTVQAAADPYKTLNDYINQQNTAIGSAVNQGKTQAQNASQYAQGQLGNTVNEYNSNLQNELTGAQKSITDYNTNVENLRSQLQSGDLSGATGVDSGLTDFYSQYMTPWMQARGSAINAPQLNYVNALPNNMEPMAPTLPTVASKQDYAKLQALSSLAGSPINSPLTASTANQAGTFKAPTVGNVDNKAIAQDMLSQLEGTSGNITGAGGNDALAQWQDYEQSLLNYLGQGNADYGRIRTGTDASGKPIYGISRTPPTIAHKN